jgi:outer membrane protein assembly factor BamB
MRDRSRAGQRGLWRVVAACMAVQTSLALAGTGDWPQWRGPSRDGVAVGVDLPDSLPASLKPLWQIEVGAGYSGPVVSGDKVVVLSRQGDDEVVQCLNASDGKVLWRSSCSAPYEPAWSCRRSEAA